MNAQTTNYTLDLATGLTQVLADGTHTYLYGDGRIAQYAGTNPEYFLTDALGSVRHLVDASGNVTLAEGYQPYGEVLESAGSGSSAYGFAGEWTDSSGLVYLRARYYSPMQGRFMTRDTWGGSQMQPMSYNLWLYVYSNPVNNIDSSGYYPLGGSLVRFLRGPNYDGKWNPDGSRNGNNNGDYRTTYFAPEWTGAEKSTVTAAIWDIARAYARTYNALAYEILDRECGNDYLYLTDHLNAWEAFLLVHGGPVTFERKAENALQFFSQRNDHLVESGVWAEAQSARLIYIFANTTANDITAHPRFPVHEMGHAFENALYETTGEKSGRTDLPESLWYRKVKNIENGGFAGGFLDWQFSREEGPYNSETGQDGRGEIFADMYIGWVYNRWGDNSLGIQRAEYMNTNMPWWILDIILERWGGS